MLDGIKGGPDIASLAGMRCVVAPAIPGCIQFVGARLKKSLETAGSSLIASRYNILMGNDDN